MSVPPANTPRPHGSGTAVMGPAPGHGGDPARQPGDDGFAADAAEAVWRNREELVAVLETIATRRAAEDEIGFALAALRGADGELAAHRPRHIGELGVFLPSNNLLYSYVLFGLIPALYTRHIVMRPSQRALTQTREIHRIMSADPLLRGRHPVELVSMTQREFLGRCADAEAVVFNGRPENAIGVGERMGENTLFLAFGSGPNPLVVGADGDVKQAAADILGTRMFNSGQDCLCPDVVFAHDDIADDLLTALREGAAEVPVGPLLDPRTVVAPLSYPDAVEQAAEFLGAHRDRVTFGGRADPRTGLVEPTVLDLSWDPSFAPPEFFAPVVCVMRYSTGADLQRWLDSPAELLRGMYVSVYGEHALRGDRAGTGVVLRERTALDAEDGNQPLGGYGWQAGHVRSGGRVTARPLLLSAELGRGDTDAEGPRA
ncbi:aldehyde dehydrogenase family protein [Streptomyces neyagawaensis]|uniref:aldehyde dehydrogenase family protein n=1 Tax=Streptomyces neyagawaensis TaxID=42238 RepID=UPI00201D07E8|nr:aldehyde dehydrogenase family protein [Streptomyces neyagawaensis]MCL6736749.1 aldehyde dehydrogenase family protein [Streptomyces neyagawaensis]MDE1684429.1 aldehyde dehydrogenase family protein [Streptomyces neyagawaensis]